MTPPAGKRVLLLLHRPPAHPRTAQALRAAVGYLTADLQLTLVFCQDAAALLQTHRHQPAQLPLALRRPLDLLRGFSQPLYIEGELADEDLAALARGAHAVISW